VRELRDRILTGALPPGTRLDLDAITAEFGTSRTPVREALLQLSYEGLVEVAPRSGVTVIGVTPADAIDSFAILATLSGKAAEWAASRIQPDDLQELRRLADIAAASSDGDLVDANWRFHGSVHRAAGSRRLLTLIAQAVRVVPSNFFEVFPDQEHHSHAEHDQLLKALTKGDGTKARKIAEQHVLGAGESLAAWLAAH
jgi:DNA-binding GntR family transcriptional regulator